MRHSGWSFISGVLLLSDQTVLLQPVSICDSPFPPCHCDVRQIPLVILVSGLRARSQGLVCFYAVTNLDGVGLFSSTHDMSMINGHRQRV